MDGAGNRGDWVYGPEFVVDVHQETSSAITYTGTWPQQAVSSAYGGSLQYANVQGAKAKTTFTGSSIAWIAPKDKKNGKAEVWIDGVKITTLDLRSSSAQARKVVFTQSWPSSGSHTLEVRVLGTPSRPRVDIDAFVILR